MQSARNITFFKTGLFSLSAPKKICTEMWFNSDEWQIVFGQQSYFGRDIHRLKTSANMFLHAVFGRLDTSGRA